MRPFVSHAKRIFLGALAAAGVLLIGAAAQAHNPRIVSTNEVNVKEPEISQAFYDTLAGAPRIYHVESAQEFNLYLNLLAPKTTNPNGRYSANVYRLDGKSKNSVATLDGGKAVWTEFYEPFGGDYYYKGPEFKKRAPAGKYDIEVFSGNNAGKYVLAIGETEKFGIADSFKLAWTLPKLKTAFFGRSVFAVFLGKIGMTAAAAAIIFFAALGVVRSIRRMIKNK